MLLKQLSDEDARVFLCVAELLSLSDKPILWDGKQRNEIAAKDIGSAKISLKRSEQQIEAMKALVEATSGTGVAALGAILGDVLANELSRSQVESRLIQRLESLPLDSMDDQAIRVSIVRELMSLALRGKKAATPFVPKLMLFELMLFVLGDGGISGIQWNLLEEFSHHYRIDDYIVQDLLERAEITHQEAQKTIAIILE
ncbi:hypothetical protein [Burkholderia stabilis]|uniref:Uncharacterized protein n=1 Tax=Burkholderia stabilis TaxID=95485 RepID=A0AAJ5T8X2_9BURK|nr:hypothetical protein [Burkholderia stabilis]VBB17015.1 hypothetical protein BSTAB16_7230 [Burkholderia stabilis]